MKGYLYGAIALALITALSFTHTWAYKSGKKEAEVAALANSVKILRERNTIDETVSVVDASALCGDFGLSDNDKAECVRRVQEADAKPRDVGVNPKK